jgi:hypothetical protein
MLTDYIETNTRTCNSSCRSTSSPAQICVNKRTRGGEAQIDRVFAFLATLIGTRRKCTIWALHAAEVNYAGAFKQVGSLEIIFHVPFENISQKGVRWDVSKGVAWNCLTVVSKGEPQCQWPRPSVLATRSLVWRTQQSGCLPPINWRRKQIQIPKHYVFQLPRIVEDRKSPEHRQKSLESTYAFVFGDFFNILTIGWLSRQDFLNHSNLILCYE